ncbi:hypothetical protein N8J89_35325 [Crossiella sp. CA-258035]|uniref:hypothetical protein n=1 Tax=Crossiella sp. CA-258035 TaxID=2981138 RepID=UPI0024BBEF5A|nr:hypothetical protein [Crossiella sp. CA-258035]WHT18329.1 hypothetical protein N8J89_35325 [Crossiella sp. CA-258035]
MDDKVRASVEAMRADAGEWSSAAREVGQAHSLVKNLMLNEEQFSMLLDHIIGPTYEQVRQALESLLESAAAEFDKVGMALRMSAETYEREDAEGAHGLRRAGG